MTMLHRITFYLKPHVAVTIALFITGFTFSYVFNYKNTTPEPTVQEPVYVKTDVTLSTIRSLEACNVYAAQSVQRYMCSKRILDGYVLTQTRPCKDEVKAIIPALKLYK